MTGVILLTGATGFLGTQIARRLLQDTEHTIVALVRSADEESGVRRLSQAWWDWPELAGAIGDRVEALCGDVCLPRLGLDEATHDHLVRRVTHIIHAAADLRLDASTDELRRTNVQGTKNVLQLARAVHTDHSLERFSHISTAYVAGGRRGSVPEDALTDAFGFLSTYERSKYEGELLVQSAKTELPISVFRPGMIVGDSRTGEIKTFNTLYVPLRLYLTGRLRVLPARASLRLNIVPVDYVAEAIVRLTLEPRAVGLNFHLTAPHESLPTARELVAFVRGWARERLGLRLGRPLFIPVPFLATLWRRWGQRMPRRDLFKLLPYLFERRHFQRDNVDQLLGPYAIKWRDMLPPILAYAIQRGFMHRSERTVHEQVLFRLKRRSRPVTYHDVIEGEIITHSAAEVQRDILAAASALHGMGIRPGDRVALVGLNSTRHLTLDVAIGLVGAVSVPLYYTSPPDEIDEILSASGSRLLLIGAPRLLERLGELESELPVVSFCRGPLPEGLTRKVVAWEAFLAQGAKTEMPASVPVGLGDPATIRYTSGTTGQSKGVAFKHEHLRWMAETVALLPPWKVRNSPITYLSFLPMNHVVEGILATYSPYYAPAPLHIYFLEDFHDLQRTLPRVRPTMLFSVPRFYEKVWEGLLESGIGRRYVACRDGLGKRALRWLVRRALLRRAGLDRCAQLIVGSAPASEELLNSFHALGIEVHNAYGLTEAPLVSMNRVGANRLGTVGEPLPLTEVRVARDGEILVRGPQVAAGYFASEEPLLHDGWLPTGDLGYLTRDGDLVLCGRKKELIVTSYGKNIHPGKVEALLRKIPGVAEAMLVGDDRPYCVALIWLNNGHGNGAYAEAVDVAIGQVNAYLSRPEQAKRWAILPYDLSIEGGDLTANLKLKRRAVARRFEGTIRALYGEEDLPSGALHLGRSGGE